MINQLAECVLYVSITIDVGFDGIDDTIISNATFYNVKTTPGLFSCPAVYNEVEPFFVVSIESLCVVVG